MQRQPAYDTRQRISLAEAARRLKADPRADIMVHNPDSLNCWEFASDYTEIPVFMGLFYEECFDDDGTTLNPWYIGDDIIIIDASGVTA